MLAVRVPTLRVGNRTNKVSKEDVIKVLLCTNRHSYLDYDCFHFPPKRIRVSETPCQILKMFEELQFFEKFHIKRETLVKFILYCKKGYRDTPYHNWMHAFAVTHFAYVAIKQLKLIENGYLTMLEALAYMISCMCHDIDHRGTTNAFQKAQGNVLANLYSSEGSVMEHHHLSQSLCILNTEDCNFLDSLANAEYVTCLALIKEMILATDLQNHFKLAEKQQALVEKGYDPNNSEHHYVLTCLLMTCADLSDQTKSWDVVKIVAQHIYDEFFLQGDIEKSMGQTPMPMMDREQARIPELQISFLNEVCLPVYTTLSELFPVTGTLVRNIMRNVLCWEACRPYFEKCFKDGNMTSMQVLTSPAIDQLVSKIFAMDKASRGSVQDLEERAEDDVSEEEEETD